MAPAKRNATISLTLLAEHIIQSETKVFIQLSYVHIFGSYIALFNNIILIACHVTNILSVYYLSAWCQVCNDYVDAEIKLL